MTFLHKLRLCANSHQSSESSQLFKSFDTRTFQRYFCPPASCLPSIGVHINSCFGRILSFIREIWPRKWNLCWESTEESFYCLAILLIVMCHFFSLMDTLRMILRQCITKPCKRYNWGSWRTKLYWPYRRVDNTTALKMLSWVQVFILRWYQRIWHRERKALEALQILESTSIAVPQLSCTMMPTY